MLSLRCESHTYTCLEHDKEHVTATMTALNVHHHNHNHHSRVEYRINLLYRSVHHSVYHQPCMVEEKNESEKRKIAQTSDTYKQYWPFRC